MLAGRNRRAGMPDADGRIAGRFDHDVHRAAGNRARPVIGESGSRDPLCIPADGAAGFAGTVAIEIDDDGYFKPRRVRYLRQKHRAEFSGTDQRDANRLAGRMAGVEEAVKVHESIQSRILGNVCRIYLVMAGQKREARLRARCPGHPRLAAAVP